MDDALRAADRAMDRQRALKLLREVSADPEREFLKVHDIIVVKHRIGRRLTLRYEVDRRVRGAAVESGSVYAKVYRGRRGERIHRFLTWWHAVQRAHLHLPRSIGYSAKRRVLLLEALPGETLDRVIKGQTGAPVQQAFGVALAGFHARQRDHETVSSVLPAHDVSEEMKVLDRACDRVRASALPDNVIQAHVELCSETAHRLNDRAIDPSSVDESILHRDLYPQQVLVHAGQLGLVDLDELSRGEPELDVGNFVAHLLLTDFQERGRPGPARARMGMFLDGYTQYRAIDTKRLRIYTAATLLRLASLERVADPARSGLEWPRLAGTLIDEARACLTAVE